jgi:hypothetical protein
MWEVSIDDFCEFLVPVPVLWAFGIIMMAVVGFVSAQERIWEHVDTSSLFVLVRDMDTRDVENSEHYFSSFLFFILFYGRPATSPHSSAQRALSTGSARLHLSYSGMGSPGGE